MEYVVIVRTKKDGYLAYEFRMTADKLITDRAYQEIVKDDRYKVTLLPVSTWKENTANLYR